MRNPLHQAMRMCTGALRRSSLRAAPHSMVFASSSASDVAAGTATTKGALLKLWSDLDVRAQRIRTTSEPHLRRAKVQDLEKQSVQPGFWDDQLKAQSILRVRPGLVPAARSHQSSFAHFGCAAVAQPPSEARVLTARPSHVPPRSVLGSPRT